VPPVVCFLADVGLFHLHLFPAVSMGSWFRALATQFVQSLLLQCLSKETRGDVRPCFDQDEYHNTEACKVSMVRQGRRSGTGVVSENQHYSHGLSGRPCQLRFLSFNMNATLQSLDIRCHRLGGIGTKFIADGLAQNTTLRSLDMSEAPIGDKACQLLIDMIQTNSTLTELNFRCRDPAFMFLFADPFYFADHVLIACAVTLRTVGVKFKSV
jgi:hypothetical protein